LKEREEREYIEKRKEDHSHTNTLCTRRRLNTYCLTVPTEVTSPSFPLQANGIMRGEE